MSTKRELLLALKNATRGQIVYVDDAATIDLTGHFNIRISEGVILASGRGRDNSRGGLLLSSSFTSTRPLLILARGSRITGLRIQGPGRQHLICIPLFPPGAIRVDYTHSQELDRVRVDNNEIYGWSGAGVVASRGKPTH